MRLALAPHLLSKGGKHDWRTCGGATGGCKRCHAQDLLRDVRQQVTTAANVAMRAHVRADTDLLDAFVLAHGRMPRAERAAVLDEHGVQIMEPVVVKCGLRKGQPVLEKDGTVRLRPKTTVVSSEIEWPYMYNYGLVCKAAPTLNTGIASTIQRSVAKAWLRWRFDTLILQKRSPPFYRNAPIPVRAADVRLKHIEGDEYEVSLSLHAGRHPGGAELRLPIEAKDERMRSTLANLVSGHWRIGQMQIEEHRQKPGKWFARIAYTCVVKPVPRSEKVAAINRGICSILAVVTHTGEQWVYDGADLVVTLQRLQAERRSIQRQIKVSSRTGRGRKKALAAIRRLEEKGERWRRDRCQWIAARLAGWLDERDICHMFREDFEGIRLGAHERLGEYIGQLVQEWPYYQLGVRIDSCLEEAGIGVQVLPTDKAHQGEDAAYASQQCPACEHTSPDNMDLAHRVFRCRSCDFRRHLDVACAMNVLVRGCERSGDAAWAGIAREKRFLKSHAMLHGPATEKLLADPHVESGANGTARQRGRKPAKPNGNGGAHRNGWK